jgi:hypothetical protein
MYSKVKHAGECTTRYGTDRLCVVSLKFRQWKPDKIYLFKALAENAGAMNI